MTVDQLRAMADNLTMKGLVDMCQKKGTLPIKELDDIAHEFQEYERPRPAGYSPLIAIHIGGMKAVALLDTGATATAMDEDLAVEGDLR